MTHDLSRKLARPRPARIAALPQIGLATPGYMSAVFDGQRVFSSTKPGGNNSVGLAPSVTEKRDLLPGVPSLNPRSMMFAPCPITIARGQAARCPDGALRGQEDEYRIQWSQGFGKCLPPAIMTPETSRESLPPAMPPRAERSSQHERLLPHGSFRPPQLAGDLPGGGFLRHRFKLTNVTLGPLAPSNLSSSHGNILLSDKDTYK